MVLENLPKAEFDPEKLPKSSLEKDKQEKSSVEKKDESYGFEKLEKDFEKNEATKELLDMVGSYVDFKLEGEFSDAEKNNIKLVILGEIQDKLKLTNVVESIVKNLLEPLNKLLAEWKQEISLGEKVKKSQEQINEIGKKFKKVFSSFGLELEIEQIDKQIQELNKEKKENKKEFNSLEDTFNLLHKKDGVKKTDKQIYDDIKTKTLELSKKLNSGREFGSGVKEGLAKIPFNFGEKIMDFLKGLVKSFPIIGFIFEIIFGKDFLSEESDNNSKATNNLIKFAENDDFPLKNNIKSEDIKKLEPKKLEKFYKFLDGEDIDYTKEDFWEYLLTGKTSGDTSKKIEDLYNLLKDKDGIILKEDEKLDDLIVKLNGLKELKSQENQKKREQKTEQKAKKVTQTKTEVLSKEKGVEQVAQSQQQAKEKLEKTTKELEKAKQEKVSEEKIQELKEKAEQEAEKAKEEEEKLKRAQLELEEARKEAEKAKKEQEEDDFENSVSNIRGLHSVIKYKGEEINLDIVNNIITLGSNEYKISIIALKKDHFEKIEFIDGEFVINGSTSIPKEQIKELIVKLLNGENFEYKGTTKKKILFVDTSIDYELKVTKV